MAEVKIDVPATNVKFKTKDDHMRRNSTGNLDIHTGGVKVQPHYLRASSGSCHDFCKYGIKHVSEKKQRNPFFERFTTPPEKRQDLARTANLVQIKKKSAITPKPPPQFKSPKPHKFEVIKKEVPVSPKIIAISRKHASAEHASLLKSKSFETRASSFSAPRHLSRRHSEIIIPKGLGALQVTSMGGSSSRRNSEIKISKDMGTSKMSKPATVSPSPKPSLKRVLSTKSRNNNPRKVSPMKNHNIVRKAETVQPYDENVPEKTLYVIESKAENQTVGVAENGKFPTHSTPSSENRGSRYSQNEVQTFQLAPFLENENLRCKENSRNGTQFSSSSSLLSKSKDPRHTQNGTRNTQSSSSISSESMHSDKSGLISYHGGTKTQKKIVGPKVEHKSRPRRIERVSSEDIDCSPQKLKFRRGKVVNVRPENSSPRRLKFRQGKALGENQNCKADTRGRSLRRLASDSELNGTKTKSVKVVLRHQVVDGKKGTQSLFNNVIEETASKLVQTRKSKVKALVGAFETVISLQDSKSSEIISTC